MAISHFFNRISYDVLEAEKGSFKGNEKRFHDQVKGEEESSFHLRRETDSFSEILCSTWDTKQTKCRKRVILSLMYHHQNPLELLLNSTAFPHNFNMCLLPQNIQPKT